MDEQQKELAKVIEKYFGADAGYLDISCLDLARVILEAGWEKPVRCCDCVSCKVILDNVGAGHCHCKKRYGLPEVDPTDFCSCGERREGE